MDRQTAVRAAASAAGARARHRSIRVSPEYPPSNRIESDNIIRTLEGIQDAIYNEGCRLGASGRLALPKPSQFQILDISRRDLGEWTITLSMEASRVSEPVLRF